MKYPEIFDLQHAASLQEFDDIIDVRSPAEFAEDHIHGAINCPVLDDGQRILIGTMYKQTGSFEAKRLGAALIAENIARHLQARFQDRPKTWRPLIYCWRGGNRSGSMAHIFARIGWPVAQLNGGYKSYRTLVNQDLSELRQHFEWQVLCGPTGSGKSRLLQSLQRAGAQVLDLEQLACHRGSVLGGLPDQPQPSQKMFESGIWTLLQRFDCHRPVYVEAESKKVGNLRVPEKIMDAIRSAACINLQLEQTQRVRLLMEDYAHYVRETERLNIQLGYLAELHGKQRIQEWAALADAGQIDQLVRQLLDHHYDPAYHKSIGKNFRHYPEARLLELPDCSASSFDLAAAQLIAHQAPQP